MKYEKLTIENIGDGVLAELFNREMKQIIANIQDNNTDLKQARELNIKIKVVPSAERDFSSVKIQCSSKLAPVTPVNSSIYLEGDEAFYRAGEKDEELLPANVSDIKGA